MFIFASDGPAAAGHCHTEDYSTAKSILSGSHVQVLDKDELKEGVKQTLAARTDLSPGEAHAMAAKTADGLFDAIEYVWPTVWPMTEGTCRRERGRGHGPAAWPVAWSMPYSMAYGLHPGPSRSMAYGP